MYKLMTINAVTFAQRPELYDEADRLACSAWPEFLLHVNTANAHFGEFLQTFPDHQFILRSDEVDLSLFCRHLVKQ